jgi:signal transduction histidine kinase
MGHRRLLGRYRILQSYIGWTADDETRIRVAAPFLSSHLKSLVDDFYEEIRRHPEVGSVITGGAEQIGRLKSALSHWIEQLLSGCYDEEYVAQRWRVGCRHVEIGLDQIYTNAAISRLRSGLLHALHAEWPENTPGLMETAISLTRLMDLDLAIMEDVYQSESSRKLQQHERLATMGQVAGGVAHELRNPLNVVKTSVYFLLNARNPTPEKKAEHLQRIERNVELADGVITTLTSFVRMPTPDIRSVSVERCIREILDVIPVDGSIRHEITYEPGLPEVQADGAQLRIVFGNIIRNARDAMPDGGTLSIKARRDENEVIVEISDTGVGIAPDVQARITEPLYSTKSRGLGLGLAIVRSILEKIEGQLRVSSVPGRGSTFTVGLKVSPDLVRESE